MTLQTALTKAALARRTREIKDGRPLGPLPEVDSDWLIWNVFSNHPRWAEKARGGVQAIELGTIAPFNSRCFYVRRCDGSIVDVSYKESLNPKKHTARVREAARWEVERDVRVWKIKNPPPEARGFECDHIHPFDAIWAEFLATKEVDEEHVSVLSDPVGSNDYFENRKLAHEWARFHFNRAEFQWLSQKANAAKSNQRADEPVPA